MDAAGIRRDQQQFRKQMHRCKGSSELNPDREEVPDRASTLPTH